MSEAITEDEPDITDASRNKRQRVHFSCSECHRRKQKCDRRTPCNHCIARKIPERCKTFQPGEDPGDIIGRLTRLESTVNGKLDLITSVLRNLTQAGTSPANPLASTHTTTPKREHFSEAPVAGQTSDSVSQREAVEDHAEGSEAGDEVMLHSGEPTGDGSTYGPGNFTMRVETLISDVADHRASRMADPIVLTAPLRQFEQSQQLDAIMHDFGATFSISKVLLAALPSPDLCRALIDHFFENNWLRQPLSRKHFMEGYDSFWQDGPILTVNNLNVYALYLLTASIGVLTYRGSLRVSDDPRAIRLMAKRLFFSARQSLLISSMLGREDMEQVVALHLASRFLFIDRRISEAWSCVASAVKTAHSIGLHRDGSLLGLPEKVCAARRRIWSITYFTERILCMNLGRPTAIDDGVVDTAMVDENDVEGDFEEYTTPPTDVTLPPGEVPRFLTFTLMRQRLARIIGKVISIYQNIHSPAHYSDVVSIDHSLETLHDSLPDHLRSHFDKHGQVRHLKESWDDIFPFIPVHRYLQQAEILFVRMSLHRPYLIRNSNTRRIQGASRGSQSQQIHRYNFSRRSCIEAAYQTLILRKDLSDRIKSRMADGEAPPSWAAHLGTYNTLSAIVILGIYLLMEPNAENAAMLLQPLRMFYDMYKAKRQSGSDDIKEREFTILHMFLERIDEARLDKGKRKRRAPYASGRSDRPSSKDAMSTEIRTEYDSEIGERAKEQDTAGALLRLKTVQAGSSQSNASRKDIDIGVAREAEAGQTNEVDDGNLPWPYLPLHTPHYPGAPFPKGSTVDHLSGSPLASKSTSEQDRQNSPTQHGSVRDDVSIGSSSQHYALPSDGQNGASVHQLFDSWFRSNAFENADVDVLGAGQDKGLKEVLGTFSSTNSLGAPLTGIGGPYMGFGQPLPSQNPAALRSSQSEAVNGGVPWSTVPAPSYSAALTSTSEPRHSNRQHVLNASTQQTNNDQGLTFSALSGQDALSGAHPQNQTFDSTYDPAFWQR
jgi:hypothetical protein